MTHNPKNLKRRSIRLKNYDYSQMNAYFVTICTHNRECIFGEIINGEMVLNEFGKIVNKYWLDIPDLFPHVELDEFIIMPNHIHVIIIKSAFVGAGLTPAFNRATDGNRAPARGAPTMALGNIIGAYKSLVSNDCLKIYKSKKKFMGKLWQRNYYEHIIRIENEMIHFQEYILNNPLKWDKDQENPVRKTN